MSINSHATSSTFGVKDMKFHTVKLHLNSELIFAHVYTYTRFSLCQSRARAIDRPSNP